MQGLGGPQLWYGNNFLLCEASVNLGITKCKISSQYGPETINFFRGKGWGGGVEIIKFAYYFHSSLCTLSTHIRTLQMDAQHNSDKK